MHNDTTNKKNLDTYATPDWEARECRRDTAMLVSYSLISFAIVAGLFNLMFA